jgi:hypothetical protein
VALAQEHNMQCMLELFKQHNGPLTVNADTALQRHVASGGSDHTQPVFSTPARHNGHCGVVSGSQTSRSRQRTDRSLQHSFDEQDQTTSAYSRPHVGCRMNAHPTCHSVVHPLIPRRHRFVHLIMHATRAKPFSIWRSWWSSKLLGVIRRQLASHKPLQ